MVPMRKPAIVTTVNDFTVLPLSIPPTSSYPHSTIHYLYLRPNTPKLPTPDSPREAFLVNLPIDATETHLRSLFADQLGGARVESIAFEGARIGKGITAPVAPARGKKRKRSAAEAGQATVEEEVGLLPETWDRAVHATGGTAVVTFVDQASRESVLKAARRAVKDGRELTWGRGVQGRVPPLGSARYTAHHALRYPDPAQLQESVDAFMAAFAAQETARTKAATHQRSVPDEDGFITVTRGGRTGPAREEEAKAKEEEAKAKEEELKKRGEKRVEEGFYRFQVRERKKEEAKGLVRGFEEDRRKVEEMRKRRGKVRPE